MLVKAKYAMQVQALFDVIQRPCLYSVQSSLKAQVALLQLPAELKHLIDDGVDPPEEEESLDIEQSLQQILCPVYVPRLVLDLLIEEADSWAIVVQQNLQSWKQSQPASLHCIDDLVIQTCAIDERGLRRASTFDHILARSCCTHASLQIV